MINSALTCTFCSGGPIRGIILLCLFAVCVIAPILILSKCMTLLGKFNSNPRDHLNAIYLIPIITIIGLVCSIFAGTLMVPNLELKGIRFDDIEKKEYIETIYPTSISVNDENTILTYQIKNGKPKEIPFNSHCFDEALIKEISDQDTDTTYIEYYRGSMKSVFGKFNMYLVHIPTKEDK